MSKQKMNISKKFIFTIDKKTVETRGITIHQRQILLFFTNNI